MTAASYRKDLATQPDFCAVNRIRSQNGKGLRCYKYAWTPSSSSTRDDHSDPCRYHP